MPLLASCWLIVESFIIPEGFLKWFCLSFYIHFVFLCFCQIFLWIKQLQRWCSLLILFLCRLILCVSSYCTTILRFLRGLAFSFASPTRAAASCHALDEEGVVENEFPEITSSENQLVIYATGRPCYSALPEETYYQVDLTLNVKLEETDAVSIDESPSFVQLDNGCDCSTSSPSSLEAELNPDGEGSIFSVDSGDTRSPLSAFGSSDYTSLELDVDSNEILQPNCIPYSPVESKFAGRRSLKEELDSVYVMYEERMKWFDLLSRDRVYGIDAIQKMDMRRPGLLEMVPADLSMASTLWSEKAREKLIKSLRSDFELVYVAQSCLSWDALHYQYHKVEAIANSNQNSVFRKETAERLQEFHILLERFVEDEHIIGPRHSSYVRRRFSYKKLLQVPQVSTIENDMITGEVENVKATQVLKIIEDCIKVFWLFIKVDAKKSTWKLKSSSGTHPPVEDPRDLVLLYELRKILREKELLLRNQEGKKGCWWWWKKTILPQVQIENQKVDDLLCTMINLKLVKNVLQMSTISTSQLNWCRRKLTNTEIRQRTEHTYLFPSCS